MNGKIFITSVLAMLILLISSDSPQAEIINTTADLENSETTIAYVFSRPMLETMYRLGIEKDKKFGLQSDCKSQFFIKPFYALVVKPIEFPEGKQHPTKGVWMSRYEFERCGSSKFYNVLFFANINGETPVARAFYAGSTTASPLLIKDAMPSVAAFALASGGLTDCKELDVFDMRVTEAAHNVVEGEKTFKGVVGEVWTFRACGKIIDVAITFIPKANGAGTSFTYGPVKSGESSVKP